MSGAKNGYFLIQFADFKYCSIVNREHSHNRQYVVLDTIGLKYSVRCYKCENNPVVERYIVFPEDFVEDFLYIAKK